MATKVENVVTAIKDAREQGRLLLSEEEGKRLIKSMGVLVPAGVLAATWDEARQAGRQLGFPLVVKGLVEGVTHKSDCGLVHVGVVDEIGLKSCYVAVTEACRRLGRPWRLLIEEQRSGILEMVVSLTTDPSFGKVMMFGLGGIFVEVLKDVSFKLCPITRNDAEDMIESLKAAGIFKGIRGQKPVDTEKLVEFLLSIGGEAGIAGGSHSDAIDLIEINPAVIDGAGCVTALDVVVQLAPPQIGLDAAISEGPVDMTRLFNPRTMGVVGISPEKEGFAKEFLAASLKMGFKGRVFPINVKHGGKEVLGWRIYDRIAAVPEDIDYLYVSVPAKAVPSLLEEGSGKVHFAHIITSGFGEVGPEGKAMEETILARARDSNIRLIGPNCLGMYAPRSGITLIDGAPKDAGSIGIISQSGGLTTEIIRMGGALGLRFSQAISIGNSIDLGIEDFLHYMSQDSQTRIIGIYAEQVRDGKRFARLLKEICRVKPVVILKGGKSPLGAKAASSHTGALVSNIKLWTSLCRQYGATFVHSINEFITLLLAFQGLDPRADNTLFMFGQSGGTTVLAADLCDEYGLAVPELEAQLEKEVLSLGIPPGTCVKNPIDAPVGTLAVAKGSIVRDIFNVVGKRKYFSYELMHFNVQNLLSYSRNGLDIINNMVDLAIERGGNSGPRSRSLALVIRGNREARVEEIVREQSQRAMAAGVPVFPELSDALQSMGSLVKYGIWLDSGRRTKSGSV